METTGDAWRGDKEAGPAVPIQGALGGPEQEALGKVGGEFDIGHQLRAVQGEAPVEEVVGICGKTMMSSMSLLAWREAQVPPKTVFTSTLGI